VDHGDPRAVRTRREILDAAGALISDSGIDAVTMNAVAQQAGISRSTLYRHSTQSELLIDAIEHVFPLPVPVSIDDPFDRLKSLIAGLGESLRSSLWGSIAASLAEAGLRDPVLAEAHASATRARCAPAVKAARAAQREGLMRADVDPEWVVNLLAGPLYYHVLILHRPLSARSVAKHIDATLALLSAGAPEGESRDRDR
jgi:AcrR family transcriptional regulator